MKIVLYANEQDEQSSRCLQDVIETCIPSNCLEVYGNTHNFAKRIYHIPRNIDVVVLLAQNHEQLSELISLKDFLIDVRMILILPDRAHQTVIKGHVLCPGYTSYADSNMADIAKVLNKMILRMNKFS